MPPCPYGRGWSAPLCRQWQSFTLAVSPSYHFASRVRNSWAPTGWFFFNLLISICSPGRGYYKISRKEVENPFSLISREHIPAIATPSSPTFPEVFMITSLPTLRADQCLEVTCQALLLGKASAIKGPGSRVMALFTGGIPVVQRSNPPLPHFLTCLPLSFPLLFNWNYWFQAVRMKINELWMNWICSLPPSRPETAI